MHRFHTGYHFVTYNPESNLNAMRKYEHWEYEDEFRITKSDANKKTFTMKNSVIKEIIFGSRINPDSKAEIIKNVKNYMFYK